MFYYWKNSRIPKVPSSVRQFSLTDRVLYFFQILTQVIKISGLTLLPSSPVLAIWLCSVRVCVRVCACACVCECVCVFVCVCGVRVVVCQTWFPAYWQSKVAVYSVLIQLLPVSPSACRAGHFLYFWIFSILKNDIFAFFIKLITYFCTSPI